MTSTQILMYLEADTETETEVTFPDVASAQAYLARVKRKG